MPVETAYIWSRAMGSTKPLRLRMCVPFGVHEQLGLWGFGGAGGAAERRAEMNAISRACPPAWKIHPRRVLDRVRP